jgi:hypothetical protein
MEFDGDKLFDSAIAIKKLLGCFEGCLMELFRAAQELVVFTL